MKPVKRIWIYISVFIVISILLFIFLWNRKESLEDIYLAQKTVKTQAEFKATIGGFDKLINLFFIGFIDNDNVKNLLYKSLVNKDNDSSYREEFIKLLKPAYEKLKTFNIKYLHFYFPDGTTFLRFHNISRYGDKIKINPINPQEEFKTTGGFRYIFPIFYRKLLIGNAEIAVSFGLVRQELNRLFNSEHKFLIKKDYVLNKLFVEERKNYIQSDLDPNFFYENDPDFKSLQRIPSETIALINKQIKNRINLDKKKTFYLISYVNGDYYTVSFIPVYAVKYAKKEYLGYLVTYEKDNSVAIYSSNFWISYIAISSIVFLLLLTAFLISYIKEKIFIEEAESIDELTEAYNKETFLSLLSAELVRSKRYDRPLSIMVIDFPQLKNVDEDKKIDALRSIVGILLENIRDTDYIAHIDDTQLAILTPETQLEDAKNLAERIKEIIQHTYIEDIGKPIFYIGVTEANTDDTVETLLKRVKQALFLAEEKGENRIETAS